MALHFTISYRFELELERLMLLYMLFGLSKKQIIALGFLATGLKLALGIWLFGYLGLHLPW